MIVAPSPSASREQTCFTDLVCPSCRSELEQIAGGLVCATCAQGYPIIDGIADLRLESDRYLSLDNERAKANRLASISSSTDFRSLCRSYYAMTPDVSPQQADRYLAHLEHAEIRAHAFVDFLPQDGPVLEVGCGSGGMLAVASKRGIAIEGVDIALRWLVLARKRISSNKIKLFAANGEQLPWPDARFSCIFADSVLEHLNDLPATLKEWHRVSKPGASLILVSPNRYSLGRDPHVGLWGLGFLPRSWQSYYVRFRRNREWPVRPISVGEAAKLATDAGWLIQSIGPAPAPRLNINRVRLLYELARRLPILRGFLRQFGPVWLLVATRGDGS